MTKPGEPPETDAAALSAAEDLDEDELGVDPLEKGMDPPERWSEVDKYGVTPYEEAHPQPLAERLAEEEPDVTDRERDTTERASDSVAGTIRTPPEPPR
jgi:hypothetical protein